MFLPTGHSSDSDGLRRCGRCGRLRPLEDFAWRRRGRGQRDNYCRPCRADYHHEHYTANRQRYVDNAAERRRKLVIERMDYLHTFFATHPCVDCGATDPRVLEFDHQGGKLFNVSTGLRDRPWSDVLTEIEKCVVRCANCHRIRTAEAEGFHRALWRITGDDEREP